jgi:type VI secretion system secreted protein VgrG
MSIKQDNRLLNITASFIKNDAIATEFQATEAFSEPFVMAVSILSENHALSSSDVIGQKCCVQLNYQDSDSARYFSGRINGISLGDIEGDNRHYTLRVVPGFWFATQSHHHRIFEEMSALDIINQILNEFGDFISIKDSTSASYLTREYCVQYGESDFAFVSRLMEEEGIAYYFTHEKDKHTMVLFDATSGYTDCDEKNVKLNVGSDFSEDAKILSWNREMNFHTGTFEMTDYNHDTPKNFYKQSVSTKHKFAQQPGEKTVQAFSGFAFSSKGQAEHDFDVGNNKQLTSVRLESLEAAHDVAQGSGYCGSFFAGGRFKLEHHIKSECNSYVITKIHHSAVNKNDQAGDYKNQFSCIPDKVVFRAPQTTIKKQMRGPLTAKVVELNASTSKDDADPHRMIRVEFPWSDKAKSCWLRVAQAYAGAGWGASFVPRVNQEVLVEFLNGDPDRPLVVGAMYNKDNQGPAYTSTQSGFKTESDKFNEFRFDDKKGEEEIYVEAGKNYNFIIHNDETGEVENDQSLTVKNNRAVTVSEGDESKVISKGNQTLEVGGDQEATIKGDQSETVKGKQDVSVTGNQSITVKGSQKIAVTGGIKHDSKQSIEMKGAQSIKLQANMSIELKVGGNSIKIDPSGVTITGTMVKINGSAMTEVKGGGMLKMQGGLVMIN